MSTLNSKMALTMGQVDRLAGNALRVTQVATGRVGPQDCLACPNRRSMRGQVVSDRRADCATHWVTRE
jgi:hypothetical protein